MIFNQPNNNPTILSGDLESSNFKIKAFTKAFNILSTTLSFKKELAIIRELTCNAIKANRATGVDWEYYLHLPSTLNPYFSIRDNGVGLSHEEIMDLYGTHSESSKTGSNQFIGISDLGAKIPFCYTDTFTITSYTKGKKNIYCAYLNEEGLPCITLLSTTENKRKRGVEIKFAVEPEDFEAFHEASTEFFRFFSKKPILTNKASDVPQFFEDYEFYLTYDDNFENVEEVKLTKLNDPGVIVGGVFYPIDTEPFIGKRLLSGFEEILLARLHLYVEIGEVDIETSRKALSYGLLTINTIVGKVKQFSNAIKKYYEELYLKLNADPALFEERRRDGSVRYFEDDALFREPLFKWLETELAPINFAPTPPDIRVSATELRDKYNLQFQKIYRKHLGNTKSFSLMNSNNLCIRTELNRFFLFSERSKNTGILEVIKQIAKTEKPVSAKMQERLRSFYNYDSAVLVTPYNENKPPHIEEFIKDYNLPAYSVKFLKNYKKVPKKVVRKLLKDRTIIQWVETYFGCEKEVSMNSAPMDLLESSSAYRFYIDIFDKKTKIISSKYNPERILTPYFFSKILKNIHLFKPYLNLDPDIKIERKIFFLTQDEKDNLNEPSLWINLEDAIKEGLKNVPNRTFAFGAFYYTPVLRALSDWDPEDYTLDASIRPFISTNKDDPFLDEILYYYPHSYELREERQKLPSFLPFIDAVNKLKEHYPLVPQMTRAQTSSDFFREYIAIQNKANERNGKLALITFKETEFNNETT